VITVMSRWDSVPVHCYGDDDESEEEGTASGHKSQAKPRRKSHQRPQVSFDVLKRRHWPKRQLQLHALELRKNFLSGPPLRRALIRYARPFQSARRAWS
jgi:hypothetical protein